MTCVLSSAWAEWQQWQRWLCQPLRESSLPVLLAQSPPATTGKAWLYFSVTLGPGALLLMQPISNLGSMAFLPPQPTAGIANSMRPRRLHFKYSLLGNTHYPSGWGIVSHHWNLFGVLIKYLILHHLTTAARKTVFSHCAYSAPITKTHYSSSQPAGERKVWLCSSGQDHSKIPHGAQSSQYSHGARSCSALRSLYPTARWLCCCAAARESTFVGFEYDTTKDKHVQAALEPEQQAASVAREPSYHRGTVAIVFPGTLLSRRGDGDRWWQTTRLSEACGLSGTCKHHSWSEMKKEVCTLPESLGIVS